MWKYILIALFALLAVREINLMNQSIYIAPDNEIVVEDRTTVAELKKFVGKIVHNEFLINEPETVQETNRTSDNATIEEAVRPLTEQTSTTSKSTEKNLTSPQQNETNISTHNTPETYVIRYKSEITETKTGQNSTKSSVTAELKKLIYNIQQNEFLIEEPEIIPQTNNTSVYTPSKHSTTPATSKSPKTNLTSPQSKETHNSVTGTIETNTTNNAPEIAEIKTEQNSTQPSATPLHEATPEKETPPAQTEPLPTPTVSKTKEHNISQPTPKPKTVPTVPKSIPQKAESKNTSTYPKNFESAEERVRRILEEMKKQ